MAWFKKYGPSPLSPFLSPFLFREWTGELGLTLPPGPGMSMIIKIIISRPQPRSPPPCSVSGVFPKFFQSPPLIIQCTFIVLKDCTFWFLPYLSYSAQNMKCKTFNLALTFESTPSSQDDVFVYVTYKWVPKKVDHGRKSVLSHLKWRGEKKSIFLYYII